jgi:hypothetical protein
MAPAATLTLFIFACRAVDVTRTAINTLLRRYRRLPSYFVSFYTGRRDVGPLLWGTLVGMIVQAAGFQIDSARGREAPRCVSHNVRYWPDVYRAWASWQRATGHGTYHPA